MKILVTGGAGFIGSHLCEALLKRGDEVFAIDNLSTGSLENIKHLSPEGNFHYTIDTIMNENVMDKLIQKCGHIYHLAAAVGVKLIMDKPIETLQTNVIGSEIVLRLANKYKRKVLIASTSEVYGNHVQHSLKEDDNRILGPIKKRRWAYACSKSLDEFLAQAYFIEKKLPIVIARFFNTVGPRQTDAYGMVIPNFVKNALLNKPIYIHGDGKQTRSFTHVSDVVKASMALMQHPEAEGDVFNIGSEEEITIEDLARKIKKAANSSSEICYIPYEKVYGAGFEDMKRRVQDISKIRKLVGYKPMFKLDDIIDDVIKYFKE